MVEHPGHGDHAGHVPLVEITVERRRVEEHVLHVGHLGHVPLGDVTVEFMHAGDHIVIEQALHIGQTRDIPGPDRPVRTLGAVDIPTFQALFNGGLELLLRLWSPLCGKVLV